MTVLTGDAKDGAADTEGNMIFIWSSISICLDVKDHHKDLGGVSDPYVAARKVLKGVKGYNAVYLEGLLALGTVVMDYIGYRVSGRGTLKAQTLLIGSIITITQAPCDGEPTISMVY